MVLALATVLTALFMVVVPLLAIIGGAYVVWWLLANYDIEEEGDHDLGDGEGKDGSLNF